MAARRRVIELGFTQEAIAELTRLARSQTEPASRVERARMLLAYRETPSFYAVGRTIGVTHQTVERCVRRAEKLGVMVALDDSPRPGRERVITEEARTFVVDLACRKPKELGYSMGQKIDFRDVETIAEAVQRPTMKFVATKTAEQLDLQALHRVRA